MALLMISHNKANSLDAKVFQVAGIGLATVNSKGELKIIVEPKITRLTGEI
ncbi:hypothetical protein KEJ37_03840 [Candidatus Bathyarchaeota archaeon]|nr:hypothetical protein [Candidatus Bathyarchaeota archaeon]